MCGAYVTAACHTEMYGREREREKEAKKKGKKRTLTEKNEFKLADLALAGRAAGTPAASHLDRVRRVGVRTEDT